MRDQNQNLESGNRRERGEKPATPASRKRMEKSCALFGSRPALQSIEELVRVRQAFVDSTQRIKATLSLFVDDGSFDTN